jgi:hypothetical protein
MIRTSELTAMGYRQVNTRYPLWLKPVGYAVLVYNADRDELWLQFRGATKSLMYGSESPVTFLGLAESNLLLGGASFLANEPGYAFTTEN